MRLKSRSSERTSTGTHYNTCPDLKSLVLILPTIPCRAMNIPTILYIWVIDSLSNWLFPLKEKKGVIPNTWCHKEQYAKASEFLQSRSALANELEISEAKEKEESFCKASCDSGTLAFLLLVISFLCLGFWSICFNFPDVKWPTCKSGWGKGR